MAQQLPVPNIANINAAANGVTTDSNLMTQVLQSYHTHQQNLNNELILCGNFPVVQLQQQMQQLANSIQGVQTGITVMQAQMQQQNNALQAQMQQQNNALQAQMQQQNDALQAQMQQQNNALQVQMQQQITATQEVRASINDLLELGSARDFNLHVKMKHAKLNDRNQALIAMRGVEWGANPHIPINQVIPNFPATPSALMQLSRPQCGIILRTLGVPVPVPADNGLEEYILALREAIGLPGL